jgi:protein O-GlcNAc transferase
MQSVYTHVKRHIEFCACAAVCLLTRALLKAFRIAALPRAGSRLCALQNLRTNALIRCGTSLREFKHFRASVSYFDHAIALRPDCARAYGGRALTLLRMRRFKGALAFFQQAVSLDPDYAEAHIGLGRALLRFGRAKDALASFEQVLAFQNGNIEALDGRSVALLKTYRLKEALECSDRALALAPDNTALLLTRLNILKAQGEIKQAIDCARHALSLAPANPALHTALIFLLNFVSSVSPEEKQRTRAQWGEQFAKPLRHTIRPHANDKDPNRPLRIGYVSGNFRRQAATYAFGGVLLSHDPSRFEVICYSDTIKEDEITRIIRQSVKEWHNIVELSDEDVAELIRRHRIDILVDCAGHMDGNRLGVFARKPAPLQVTAWGEPTGTGLKTIDYLLADAVLVTDSERRLLVERVVDLPNFIGYWTPTPLPEAGELPALKQGFVTFGSFNRLEKLSPETIDAWVDILRKLPASRLVLKDRMLGDADQRMRIECTFAERGVGLERLTILGHMDRDSHLAAYAAIDIALDPFPHSGGMTTLDALWMGIPVVAWAGESISGRLAASCLTASGLSDFVATSPKTYVDLAVAKAHDLEAISRLRSGLRTRLAASEFGDCARYGRAIEAAYRQMWRNWCRTERADNLSKEEPRANERVAASVQ